MLREKSDAVYALQDRALLVVLVTERANSLINLLQIQRQADRFIDEPVNIFFSGGKDAIVATHQWFKRHKGPKYLVYFYFVDGLSIIEKTLKYYENLFGANIIRLPCFETKSLTARRDGEKKTRYSQADDFKAARELTGAEWSVTGMKRNDSLARRGMLQASGLSGIDEKTKLIHPVIDWTDKEVLAYCRINKLPLPVSYSMGFKNSFWIPDTKSLLWLKAQFPSDYRKILNAFPDLENGIFRVESKYGCE